MKELIIHDNEAGQRLDKLLRKYLSEAPGSFIYKMLRKKNIVLNGKKATGNEHLKKGDSVKLFLADDTIAKFQAAGKTVEESIKNTVKLDVIYEDQNVIFINKPSGMLSQKAKETDVSVVENVTAYLPPVDLQPSGPEYQRSDRCREESGRLTADGRIIQETYTEKILSVYCKGQDHGAGTHQGVSCERREDEPCQPFKGRLFQRCKRSSYRNRICPDRVE